MRRSMQSGILTLSVVRKLWAVVLITSMVAIVYPSIAGSTTTDPAINDAITCALNHNHQSIYNQQCLAFVAEAYAQGNIALGAIGDSNGAAQYWAKNPKNYVEHPNNLNPPVGALVFWGPTPAPYANPYGHVGIYLGNNTVISSASWPETGTEVHEFSFTGRNAASDGVAPFTPGFYPYLGWIAPTAISSGGGSSNGSDQPTLGVDWASWITGFKISPAPTNRYGAGTFVYKRSGSTWAVINPQLFEFNSLPGVSAGLLNSLTTTMSKYWPLVFQVPVPT